MSREPEIPNRTPDICEILWGFIEELSRVRNLKKRPALEKVLRVSHAIAQLSGAYLKAIEACETTEYERRLDLLETFLAGTTNGHGPSTHD